MLVIIMLNHKKMEKEHQKLQKLFSQTVVSLVNSIDAKARLVWHCPSVGIFTSDDGTLFGGNYRELAYVRLDGESREIDPGGRKIYATLTGDQVALTNIRIIKAG